MVDYIELRIEIEDCNETITDLLAAFLADVGYESFVSDEDGITAYIKSNDFDEAEVNEIIKDFPMEISATIKTLFIKGKDWNEEWEKNYFQPIVIDNKCVIHSTFHRDIPNAEYDIVIDPKMAFGTGHHSTTSLILRYLLSIDLNGKNVIDMGTGTGILAILSAMRGAGSVVGIEIDPGAYENAVENVKLNNVKVSVLLGDVKQLKSQSAADIFIANINRNIILADISQYVKNIVDNGTLILSGFYENDIPLVEKAANKLGLQMVDYKSDKEWVAVRMILKNNKMKIF